MLKENRGGPEGRPVFNEEGLMRSRVVAIVVTGLLFGALLIMPSASSKIPGAPRASMGAPRPIALKPTFVKNRTVKFAPATLVSAHFLGAEPQTEIERRLPGVDPDVINPKRVFVDWPLSTRTQIGQLSRSLDAGKSFRLLIDNKCAARSRPDCVSGGGGDTESDVNLYNGHVFFSDQEALAQESLSSSTDGGDTFPETRTFAVTNTTSGVDRQWLTTPDPELITVGAQHVAAFLTYHVPGSGEYIQGIDTNGLPIPQPAPQIPGVGQSGQLKVDNSNGPGRGWLYQPYWKFPSGEVTVATAYGPDYVTPASWQENVVFNDLPTLFTWIAIDRHGNAYLTFVNGGTVHLSVSPIDDPRNDPTASTPGRPGTYWTKPVVITPPGIKSTVMAEVTAGDKGRLGVAFLGTKTPPKTPSGAHYESSDAVPNAQWNMYTSVIPNALASSPKVITGKVSHRVVHTGNICTQGTTCAATVPEKDRSFADMTDITFDGSGRLGVVYMDNNSAMQTQDDKSKPRLSPFVYWAKQIVGPTLKARKPTVHSSVRKNSTKDARRDATWPNKQGADNIAGLDIETARMCKKSGNLVAKFTLKNATKKAMGAALDAYNSDVTATAPAQRLQYVVRFSTKKQVFHLSAEYGAGGDLRFFGGKLNDNDKLTNGASMLAAGYHTDANATVTGKVKKGTKIVLKTPRKTFKFKRNKRFYSATVFAMAGPAEANESTILNTMRTVDATPAFDVQLRRC
jgi:hypothetical protein